MLGGKSAWENVDSTEGNLCMYLTCVHHELSVQLDAEHFDLQLLACAQERETVLTYLLMSLKTLGSFSIIIISPLKS